MSILERFYKKIEKYYLSFHEKRTKGMVSSENILKSYIVLILFPMVYIVFDIIFGSVIHSIAEMLDSCSFGEIVVAGTIIIISVIAILVIRIRCHNSLTYASPSEIVKRLTGKQWYEQHPHEIWVYRTGTILWIWFGTIVPLLIVLNYVVIYIKILV